MFGTALSSKPMVEHSVTKARKSFFAYGSIGVYQGAILLYHVTLDRDVSCHSFSMDVRTGPSVTVR